MQLLCGIILPISLFKEFSGITLVIGSLYWPPPTRLWGTTDHLNWTISTQALSWDACLKATRQHQSSVNIFSEANRAHSWPSFAFIFYWCIHWHHFYSQLYGFIFSIANWPKQTMGPKYWQKEEFEINYFVMEIIFGKYIQLLKDMWKLVSQITFFRYFGGHFKKSLSWRNSISKARFLWVISSNLI